MTAAEAARDVESDLVAALPMEARESAAAYSRWMLRLRHVVAASGFSDGRDASASPLGLSLAAIVCEYLDALAAGATVLVVAPKPLYAVAALPARLTLGEAWAVMVDAFHEHRCRDATTADADVTSPLADVTFETVQGWELSDGNEVEFDPPSKGWGAPIETKADTTIAPQAPKRLPSMSALLQRPLGLFLRQPVRLEFNASGRWAANKFISRDVLMAAACTLAGISAHECPPRARYVTGFSQSHPRVVGVLPRGATMTRLPVLPTELPVDDAAMDVVATDATMDVVATDVVSVAQPALETVSTALQWSDLRDYVYQKSRRARPHGEPLTDAALQVLNDHAKPSTAAAHWLVFDPVAAVLRPSHWHPLHFERQIELHGNWRVFCDKYLSPAVNAALERFGAAVAFEPATSHWFPASEASIQFTFGGAIPSGRAVGVGSNVASSGWGSALSSFWQ